MGDQMEPRRECEEERRAAPAPAMRLMRSAAAPSQALSKKEDDAADGDDVGTSAHPTVAMKKWDPDMPYLRAIKESKDPYAEYIKQRAQHGGSPSFFLDCSTWFFEQPALRNLGQRILSSIADLGLDDPQLLRIVGYKMFNENFLVPAATIFEKVLKLRKNEPQSFRDLALVVSEMEQYDRALTLFNEVILGAWDSKFTEIEVTALMEANRVINLAKHKKKEVKNPLDPAFVQLLDVDVRISMAWDTDNTDMDLHVIEPDGTETYYGHNRSPMGGLVSRDFTQGYGPEEYMVKTALPGTYTVRTKYFASHQQSLAGGTTVLLTVYTHFGRPEKESVQRITLRLQANKDMFTVAEIQFDSKEMQARIKSWEAEWKVKYGLDTKKP